MPFSYLKHNTTFLRQGEIIRNLVELKLQISGQITIQENQSIKFDQFFHPYAIVITQDCDIEFDYKARRGEASQDKLLTHILFCALFSKDEIVTKSRLKSDLYKRVRQNQDERYHHLEEAPIDAGDALPELIADFKTTFSLPVEYVNWLTSTGQATRICGLPSPYLEDFMHRLYSFLGRVAIPPITSRIVENKLS